MIKLSTNRGLRFSLILTGVVSTLFSVILPALMH